MNIKSICFFFIFLALLSCQEKNDKKKIIKASLPADVYKNINTNLGRIHDELVLENRVKIYEWKENEILTNLDSLTHTFNFQNLKKDKLLYIFYISYIKKNDDKEILFLLKGNLNEKLVPVNKDQEQIQLEIHKYKLLNDINGETTLFQRPYLLDLGNNTWEEIEMRTKSFYCKNGVITMYLVIRLNNSF